MRVIEQDSKLPAHADLGRNTPSLSSIDLQPDATVYQSRKPNRSAEARPGKAHPVLLPPLTT